MGHENGRPFANYVSVKDDIDNATLLGDRIRLLEQDCNWTNIMCLGVCIRNLTFAREETC